MNKNYIFKSPIGLLKIQEEDGKIIELSLQQKETNLVQSPKFVQYSDLLYEAYQQLNEYFLQKRKQFELPINCKGTIFQQKVWNELQNIPYGETRSYEEIAVAVKNPKAARAIGQANNKNPILIVVPCHRVIHKNGDITGFGCGTKVKQYLLDLEKIN